jgi:hypothetical protein
MKPPVPPVNQQPQKPPTALPSPQERLLQCAQYCLEAIKQRLKDDPNYQVPY